MRSTRIYTPQHLALEQLVTLDAQASHHLAKVLRAQAGDAVILFNNQGGEYSGSISTISKRSVEVNVDSFTSDDRESPLHIHLGICISKGDRMDFVMQKATELGVTEITPLLGQRSQIKRTQQLLDKKHNHWQQVAISACEQSGRNRLPTLHPIIDLESWLGEREETIKLILSPHDEENVINTKSVDSVAIAVGPEGGFSQQEVDHAITENFSSMLLGPRILRTETAPLAAITLCQARWGDFTG